MADEEFLTWSSEQDWDSADKTNIFADSSFLLDLVPDGFENYTSGEQPDPPWNILESDGIVTDSRSYNGSHSWYFSEDYSREEDLAEYTPIARNESFVSAEYKQLQFIYRETTDSTGHSIGILDSDSNMLVSAGTQNSELVIYHGDGTIHDDDVSSSYDEWRKFTITVDYDAETFDVLWEDLTGSYSDREWNGLAFHEENFSEVAIIEVAQDDRHPDRNSTGQLDAWVDDITGVHSPDGTLSTNQKTFDEFSKPNISSLLYDLNGGSIDLTVVASPGMDREERIDVQVTGETTFELDWEKAHEDFLLEFELSSLDTDSSPVIHQAELVSGFEDARSVRWINEEDWSGYKEADGVVFEDIENTDHNNVDELKRGYSIGDPDPENPYIYLPMHEDVGDVAHDFSGGGRDGDITGADGGRQGLIDTTSYRFDRSSYISVGTAEFVSAGYFQTPSSSGTTTVSGLPFEPDVIKFYTTLTNFTNGEETGDGFPYGKGRGFADTRDGTSVSMSNASGSSSTNGFFEEVRDDYSILQLRSSSDGADFSGRIRGNVTSTQSDGFTVEFDEVDSQTYIMFEAYTLEDGEDMDIGIFNMPTETGIQTVDTGIETDMVNLHTMPAADQINTLFGGDTSTGRNDGWCHGWSANNPSGLAQLTLTISIPQENVDGHRTAAYDSEIIRQLWTDNDGYRTGRIRAEVDNLGDSGFSLDYTEVDPEEGSSHPVLYCSYQLGRDVVVGWETRPTDTGTQSIINEQTDLGGTWSFIRTHTSNTFPGINREDQWGGTTWGVTNGAPTHNEEGGEHNFGFSSNSSSVNDHRETASTNDLIYQAYTDNDGNLNGRDIAQIEEVRDDGIDLNWSEVYTSHITDSVFAYYSFAGL